MNPRIGIGQLVLMFSMSTAMLGVSQDHRHNASEPAEHKPEADGQKDTYGFRSYGQYVAAAKVSEDLYISLADLRTAMVDENLSLGQAIQKVKPSLSTKQVEREKKRAEAAVKKAETKGKYYPSVILSKTRPRSLDLPHKRPDQICLPLLTYYQHQFGRLPES